MAKDVKEIIQIRSSERRCKHGDCMPVHDQIVSDFEAATNHYLQEHGYTLLHVGEETEGKTEITVAVVGK
jgi:hypothetical protein